MNIKIALFLLVVVSCGQGRKEGKDGRKTRSHRRFPKPERWMLYSSQYDPTNEEKECDDMYGPKCAQFANSPGYCHYQEDFMKKWCQKSCKWCVDKKEKPVRSLTQPIYNGNGGSKNGNHLVHNGCEDALDDCKKYIKSAKDCDTHSALTTKYCARTCGHCCSDHIAECSAFIKHPSQCSSLNGFFRKYCPYTCKFCGPPRSPAKKKDCADEISECRTFQPEDCRVHQDFAKKYCSKTCGYCDASSVKRSTEVILTAEMDGKPTTTPLHTTLTETIPEKTKCQKMQLEADPALVGAFFPECKENGEFLPRQCWGSTGYCWCVDKDGVEIPGSKVQFKEPNCDNNDPILTTRSTSTASITKDGISHSTKGIPLKHKRQKDGPVSAPTNKIKRVDKSTSKISLDSCEDKLKNCGELIEENEDNCINHVDFMKENCRKSCKFCGPIDSIPRCKDRRKRKCQLYSKFHGYCTRYKKHMSAVCPKSCGFCGVSPLSVNQMSYMVHNKKYEFEIKTQWDGSPINHHPIKIKLSAEDALHVRLEVSGPFFDQSGKPPCLAGQPCWKLWEYEVAEVFFLGEREKYLELEVSPFGPHLLLLLDGVRKPFKTQLPMRYSATIDHTKKTWNGTAIVPIDYFPPKMMKINAYAIHGPSNAKVYESLYPARNTNHPDFHQLRFFQYFDLKSMFTQGWKQPTSPFWVGRP